jgi:hypothetical protein
LQIKGLNLAPIVCPFVLWNCVYHRFTQNMNRQWTIKFIFLSSRFLHHVKPEVLTKTSEELTLSIFYPDDRGNKFLQNIS